MDEKLQLTPKRKFVYRLYDDKADVRHVHGQVILKELQADGTWKEVRFDNKVTIQGIQHLIASAYNGVTEDLVSRTFESQLYALDQASTSTKVSPISPTPPRKIIGMNLAKNGANGGDIIPFKRHHDGFDTNLNDLIPWRTVLLAQNDWNKYKNLYLHHRIVNIKGQQYVEYFTKLVQFHASYKTDDDNPIPANHGQSLATDKDCRGYVEVDINTTSDELQEHFRLNASGGADAAAFSATLLMVGTPAKITLDSKQYDTLMNTKVYSRCNHVTLYHGAVGVVDVKYELNHV